MQGATVEVRIGESREVSPPFVRIEEMSAPAMVGVIALPAQIDGPHGEALRGELPPERTKIRRGPAQSVDAKHLRLGFSQRFPDQAGETGAIVSVPLEGPRPAGDVLIGMGGSHESVIFPRGRVGSKWRSRLPVSCDPRNFAGWIR